MKRSRSPRCRCKANRRAYRRWHRMERARFVTQTVVGSVTMPYFRSVCCSILLILLCLSGSFYFIILLFYFILFVFPLFGFLQSFLNINKLSWSSVRARVLIPNGMFSKQHRSIGRISGSVRFDSPRTNLTCGLHFIAISATPSFCLFSSPESCT